MNASRGYISSHATQLEVDDAAGAEVDGRARVLLGVNALIKANRCIQFALQFGMAVNIIPSQGLLNHHQVIGFQQLQVWPIFQAIGGICVDHQADLGEALAQSFDWLNVMARLDLDFDSLITSG